jgi:UDP-N-acetylglucosamine--N-acetylmuramyl-(pentapeptide) pyrophosphoryl-undecaprenol N-acetylglucosamine transferase
MKTKKQKWPMPEQIKILISGGGTGGHIFPAVAIANALKARVKDIDILFVGAKGRMEMEKVPQAGYPIKGLWISGLQRRLDLNNLVFPFKLLSSLMGAAKIIKQFKPDVAIGTGGYASGPLLYVASKKNIPTLILEQNSYPGITNKLLGKTVDKICVAYKELENFFPKEKIVVSGTPIRKEILQLKVTREDGLKFFGLQQDKPVLLIIGGSQGAQKINEAIAKNLEKILAEDIAIIWQTGKTGLETAKNTAEKLINKESVRVVDFITRMDMAYATADLIISRAGAIAIAEIIAVNKPAIFIPLPSAAEDHQTKNAETLLKGHAAVMVKESETDEKLLKTITDLIKMKSTRLLLAQNLKRFERPDATEKIVDEIIELTPMP